MTATLVAIPKPSFTVIAGTNLFDLDLTVEEVEAMVDAAMADEQIMRHLSRQAKIKLLSYEKSARLCGLRAVKDVIMRLKLQ